MPGDTYPKFRSSSCFFLDRDATIDRLEMLVQKAVDAGADLIVFGESFIPAFPVLEPDLCSDPTRTWRPR
jgi:predicted amidohydrolase